MYFIEKDKPDTDSVKSLLLELKSEYTFEEVLLGAVFGVILFSFTALFEYPFS